MTNALLDDTLLMGSIAPAKGVKLVGGNGVKPRECRLAAFEFTGSGEHFHHDRLRSIGSLILRELGACEADCAGIQGAEKWIERLSFPLREARHPRIQFILGGVTHLGGSLSLGDLLGVAAGRTGEAARCTRFAAIAFEVLVELHAASTDNRGEQEPGGNLRPVSADPGEH